MSSVLVFFLVFIPYAASVTFNFTNFTTNNSHKIVLLGEANYSENGVLNLIDTNKSTGYFWQLGYCWQLSRATYISPLHLWDKESNHVASFSTSFTFDIQAVEGAYNDGLTFFLAQNNSEMYGGGSIGLPFDNYWNSSIYPFVAVEFDTHGNDSCDPYDPVTDAYIGNHVGININSTTSVVYEKLSGDLSKGGFGSAFIEYHSDSKVLSVSFRNSKDGSKVGLNYTLDLRDVLPEWVVMGFSAAASLDASQMNGVGSWAFNTTQSINPSPLSPTTKLLISKNKKGLVVGLLVGPLVVVTFVSILLYICWRWKYNYNGETLVEPVTTFSYQEIATSTENFADTKKLASDGSGAFYKGFLKDSNKPVAVKRVCNTSLQDIKKYSSEVKIISQHTHPNLVPLVGWCHEEQELLLLYEFFENGSLDFYLFGRENLLTWNMTSPISGVVRSEGGRRSKE